jgi:GTP-binding protein
VDATFYEFYELGFPNDPIPLSSLHGSGSGDVLDAVLEALPDFENEDGDNDVISVAVIGKPNAGKSSLINRILGDDRLIVSNIAGTTRDAIDTFLENEHGRYNFIDTAGIRRQSKVEERVEKYSVLRAKMAVERADVCLIVIDAKEGITEQDEKIAGLAHEAGKASIICVNKWDDIEKDNDTTNKFTKDITNALSYMTYAPIMFISAKTGQRVDKLFEQINYVHNQTNMRASTGMLNDVLADAVARVQPPSDKGRRLKIYYMTQTSVAPPTFVMFCNNAELFHFSYQRYLENCLRETFGFRGTPIKIIVRERGEEAPHA